MKNISLNYSSLLKTFGFFSIFSIVFLFSLTGIDTVALTFLTILITGGVILFTFNSPLKIRYIAMFLFLIKCTLLLYLHTYQDVYIFPDSYNYLNVLNRIIQSGSYSFDSLRHFAATSHIGFYYIYLLIYQFFGNDLSILLVNTLFVSVSSLLYYEAIESRFGPGTAWKTFILFSFSVNMFLFGSFILKDPIVIFLTALSFYLYINKKRMLLALSVSLFLVTVRIYSGFGVIFGIFIDYLMFSNLSRKKKIASFLSLLTISIVVMNSTIFQSYIGQGTKFVSQLSSVDVITSVPTALIKFYAAPLPWNLFFNQSIYTALIVDSFVMLFLFIGFIPFIIKWTRFKNLRFKFAIFLIPILVHALALGVEYGGDSTRQRSGIFVFLILTAILGFNYRETKE